jgi:adenylate kinase
MRIVLLGAPGSGKGTQAKLLTEKFKIPQIATGDLLRQEVSSRTELGNRAKAAMDAGELVSDQIVLGIIQSRLTKADARAGFVLDGFPRNIPQAQELDAMLARLGKPLQLAVLVDVDREVLMKRLTGRRGCTSCGAIYNIYFSPPRVPGKCDKCGSVLQHRSDDNEEAVRKRLQVYEAQSAPLASYYKAQGKLRTVRGIGSVNDIFNNICDIIEVQIRPLAAAMSRAEAAAQAAQLAARKASKEGAKATAATAAAKKATKKVTKKAAKKAAKKVKKVVKKVAKKAKKAIKKAKKKVAKKATKKATKARAKKTKAKKAKKTK